MSAIYQSLNQSEYMDLSVGQNQLSEALTNNDLEEFQLALDMGADPLIPNDNGVCVYEMALSTYGREAFVAECLRNGCSPHYVNRRLNKAAINYAADSSDPRIINHLLRHSNVMVNNTFGHLTPLNFLALNVRDDNVDDVIECMQALIYYGASTSIPDDCGTVPSEYLRQNSKLNEVNKEKIVAAFERLESVLLTSAIFSERGISIESAEEEAVPFTSRDAESAEKTMKTFYFFESNEHKDNIPFTSRFGTDDAESDEITDTDWVQRFLFFNSIKHKDNITFDELMAKGIDYNNKYIDKRPLECALDVGNCYALRRLLKQPDLNIQSVECPLSLVIKRMKDDSGDYRKCFFMLLKIDNIDINESDAAGSTALHYAVEGRHNEAINELLKRGAYLGATNNSNTLSIEGMCPSLLKEFFDSCICKHQVFRISMKYDNLRILSTESGRQQYHKEMPCLAYMAKSEDYRHLLEHPLITSFLHLKWKQLSPIFYINFLLFILFAFSIITHTMLRFSGSEAANTVFAFRIMSWIGIGYMVLRECIQLVTLPRQYFRSKTNYLELTLIALAIINCLDLDIDRQTQKVIAVITLLLIAVELFLLCGCLPIMSMSTHMLMLQEVCKSFLKSFLLYSIFVVTFSFCFYILFGTDEGNVEDSNGDFNKFTNPLRSVVKTVVMLTGEFDAGDLEFSTLYSYLLFLLFVFLMTIVLYNLLNGLAVSDIQTIMGQAKQNGTVCRIELLARYEDVFVCHSWYRRFSKNLYSVAGQSSDIEIAASKEEVPAINRETLEIALNILEQKNLMSKRQQRVRNNENRLNNIENKLADIFKRLNLNS